MKLHTLNRNCRISARNPEIGDIYGDRDPESNGDDTIKLIILHIGEIELRYAHNGEIKGCFRGYFEAIILTSGLDPIGRFENFD